MMLRYSFDMEEDAALLEAAVEHTLTGELRTGDIMHPGKTLASTTQMGEAVIAALDQAAA